MKLKNKLMAVFLSLCMVTGMISVPNVTAFAGPGPSDDPVIDNHGLTYDIFISSDSNLPYDVNRLATKVGTELSSLIDANGEPGDTCRIRTATNSIDTTDTSGWYVYDHYDTAHYADQAAWEAVYGPSSVIRPYQPYTEYECYGGDTKATLESMSKTDLSKFTSVKQLDQHIYSYLDGSGNPAMLFSGYGSPGYADFLFYPATSAGSKQVNFTVNSAYVNTHTLLGAGFLINTGIDENGFIKGYVLYYQFSSNTSVGSIRLYKIKDNVKATDFACNDGYNNFANYCDTPIAIATTPTWASLMDVQLTITPTSVTVEQKASAADDYVAIGTVDLTSTGETGYHGFGPMVQYSSHGCSDNSLFVFSNLAMSFENAGGGEEGTSLLSPLKDAQYDADSTNRYFVNLVSRSYATSGSAIAADRGIISTMQNQEIQLITNYVSVASGGAIGYPTHYLGSNAVDLNQITNGTHFENNAPTVEGIVSEISLANLAKNIAAAIYRRAYDEEENQPVDGDADSAAALILRDASGRDVKQVITGFIGVGGVKIYLDTAGSCEASTDPSFKILKEGAEEEVELPYQTDEKGNYFIVTSNEEEWPVGEYKVTVQFGETGLSASRTVELVNGIKYSVNDGNSAPASQYKSKGKSITLADGTALTPPENYSFAHWQDVLSEKTFASGVTYSTNSNLNLVAKWKLAAPTITGFDCVNNVGTVTWNEVPGATGYTVQFYKDGVLVNTKTISTGVGTASYTYSTNAGNSMSKLYAVVAATTSVANTVPNYATSNTVRYPKAQQVPGGLLDTPYTAEDIATKLGGYATLSGNDEEGYVLTFNENVQVENDLVFPSDITLDLNGHYIVGSDGANGTDGVNSNGGDGTSGGNAISLSTNAVVTIKNGSLIGGDGGNGGKGADSVDNTYNGGNGGNGGCGIVGNNNEVNCGSVILNNVVLLGGSKGNGGAGGINNSTGAVGATGSSGTDGNTLKNFIKDLTIEAGNYQFTDTFREGLTAGIYLLGNYTQNGGFVTVSGDYGIYTGGNITFTGGKLTVEQNVIGSYYSAVQCEGELTIAENATITGGTRNGNRIVQDDTSVPVVIQVPASRPSGGSTGSWTPNYGEKRGGNPITIPVATEKKSVEVSATIKEKEATIAPITTKELDRIVQKNANDKNEEIKIDLTKLKEDVTSVIIPKETMKNISDIANNVNNSIEKLTVAMDKATVELDATTLKTISEQAKGDSIQLVVEDKDQKLLNTKQKKSLSSRNVATTFEAYFVSGSERIHDFKGGIATVSFKFPLPAGTDPNYYHMCYVADDGTMTKYKTRYQKGILKFETTHFSDYAIIYDLNEKNENEVTTETVKAVTNSSFAPLCLREKKSNKDSIQLQWNKVSGADGYLVYAAKCNTKTNKYTCKWVATVSADTTTYTKKDLNAETWYKFIVKAYKLVDGKKVVIAKSLMIHDITAGGKFANAKSVSVAEKSFNLTVGKSQEIEATVNYKKGTTKKLHTTELRFASSDPKIVFVSASGKIKAKKAGTCYIYVYAQNGKYQKIKVVVK